MPLTRFLAPAATINPDDFVMKVRDEELRAWQWMATRGNPYHSKTTGKFVSGGGGHGSGTLHASPSYAELDDKGRHAVDSDLAEHGISIDELETHIGGVVAKADMKSAREWYPEAHKYANELATKHNVSVEQATAVIALTSPRTPWPRNKVLADRVLGQYRDHEGLSSREAADKIGGSFRANLIPSIDVARDPKAIDAKVSGTKRRSFYNNILAPGGTRDVTVDTWMMNTMTATADNSTFTKDTALKLLSASKGKTKVGSGYIGVSEAVRRVADKTGESPDTIQSAYWIQASGSVSGAHTK